MDIMDIMETGHNSFVTWTTGLVERIEEAEKELIEEEDNGTDIRTKT
jgi:hypothetical protein